MTKRFWSKVNKNGRTMPHMKTRCWEWTAKVRPDGYGCFYVSKAEPKLAHRVVFFLKHGRYPEPHGLHRCDNRGCVRWSHLFEGTWDDNNKDRAAKGRSSRGSKHPRAKLLTSDVKEIRVRVASGESQKSLRLEFDVSHPVLSSIINRKTWRHVPA